MSTNVKRIEALIRALSQDTDLVRLIGLAAAKSPAFGLAVVEAYQEGRADATAEILAPFDLFTDSTPIVIEKRAGKILIVGCANSYRNLVDWAQTMAAAEEATR